LCDTEKIWNQFLTVATLIAINANEAMVAPMMDLAEFAFGGSLKSGGRFCVGVWQISGFSRREDVFTFN
jgi:hypothetical protein